MSQTTEVVAPRRAPASRLSPLVRDAGVTLAVAGIVFLIAYDNGGFGESARDTFGIVLFWALVLAVGIGLWPLAGVTPAAVVTGLLLASFAVLNLASIAWAVSAEGAYESFARVVVYLGIFVVALVAATRRSLRTWTNGLALGIAAISVLALVSRLFPDLVGNGDIIRLLPSAANRLSYPIGYWNGLGIFAALGIPLLLGIAAGERTPLVRGLALAPVPVIASVIYLTSSRGAVATAAAGLIAFFVLTAKRWAAAAAMLLTGLGSAAAVWVLVDRRELVDHPFHSALAEDQGHSAALIIAGICVLTALAYGIGARLVPSDLRLRPYFGWVLVTAAVALAAVGIAAAHPVRQFDAFRQPPDTVSTQGSVQTHLLSANGSGRWQLWASAFDEFRTKPLLGRGAGSYEAWWAQHGTLSTFVQDAHSLYLETLGELGIVGFLLLFAAFATGFVAAVIRVFRVAGEDRVLPAAATAAVFAYLVGAGIDWMWELTAVAGVAFVCLGLAIGPAAAPASTSRGSGGEERPRASRRGALGLRIAGLAAGCLLICVLAVPLLAGFRLTASQDAAARGDTRSAIADALDAKSIQPWAASPYLQLALVDEVAGALKPARRWIGDAVARDPSDWRLWLIKYRIEIKLGELGPARRSFDRARSLNPRSPRFPST